MLSHFRPALVTLVFFTALTGLAYPLAITGIAQLAAPWRANGEMIKIGGSLVGSSLIGQNFTSDKYFHGRPSATTAPDPNDATKTIDTPYNGGSSTGSNLGPTSAALVKRIQAIVAAEAAAGRAAPITADAATTSASGLDPDISPQFALAQLAGVAKARSLPEDQLRALVDAQTVQRLFGFIGEPHVNVLTLNLALDALH